MRNILAFVLLLLSINAYSHTDTVLRLEEGKLIGLPEEYSPAKFNFKRLKLSISGKTVAFPECIRPEFMFDSGDLLITASWYHGGRSDSLPPYITIGHKDNYPQNLLINMNTLLPVPIEWGYGSNEAQKKCIDEFSANDT